MPELKWDDKYLVCVPRIDEQHKKLFSLINALGVAIIENKHEQIIDEVFEGLVDYVFTHFRTEEQILEEYGYPDLRQHKHEHKVFTRKIIKFRSDFKGGTNPKATSVMEYLVNWTHNHIIGTDLKYSSFFIEKGLKT